MEYFDLNSTPTFEEDDLSDGQSSANEEVNVDENESPILIEDEFEPFVGQCFLSEEEAFIFYKNYANKNGFAIRKSRFIRKKEEISRRDFFCHRGGKQPLKFVEQDKKQQNRKSLKCECKAHLRITFRRSFDIFPQEWCVTAFVKDHTHVLLAPSQVRFLPYNRVIVENDEKRILILKEAGLSVRQIMRVIELEKKVKHGYLPSLERDVRNLFVKLRLKDAKSDAMDLLNHCQATKMEDANFQYGFTTDEMGKLEHIFWSSSSCFKWYQKFGDVMVFDTTYKINAYDMPFGIFVGINNHGKTILFGCALLCNETKNTFWWLFKTFLALMGKPPKSILTDQDPWITQAISEEFPQTKHAFCIWHITTKFSGWFTALLRERYFNWCSDFYRLYRLDTAEQFEDEWSQVVTKYDLQQNKHVKGLYEIRHFLVPSYLRQHFFGGMITTGRSESINAFVKRFIASHVCLGQFVKQVDLADEDIESKNCHDTMLATFRGSSLRTLSPLEEQAHVTLTPYAFKKFQEEFERATHYSILHEEGYVCTVKHCNWKNSQQHKVYWDGTIATCTCKHFEFWGILCRHILSIFLHKDCYVIPSAYFLSRWGQDSSCEDAPIFSSSTIVVGNSSVHEIGATKSTFDIQDRRLEESFVDCPPKSVTKGRPKKSRLRGGAELGKQRKNVQNVSNCSKKNKKKGNASSAGSRKKNKTSTDVLDLNPVFSLKY